MPDGTPCWCISSDPPHTGWLHSPWCMVRRTPVAGDPDPLDVTTEAGYDSGPLPVVPDQRPPVDDRGMVLVWVIAAIAFLLAMVATLLLVAPRSAGA